MCKRLDVEHHRRRAADAAFVRARRRERGESRAAVQELDEGGLLSGDESIRDGRRLHRDPCLARALCECAGDRRVHG